MKPIACSRWTAVPLLSEPPSAKTSGNPARLAALYLSSPKAECRYSCSLIKTPDRISERPPRGGLSVCAEHDRQLARDRIGYDRSGLILLGKTTAIQIHWTLAPDVDFWTGRNSCWHPYIPFVISLRPRLHNG